MPCSHTPFRVPLYLAAALGSGFVALPAAYGDAGPPPFRPTTPTWIEVRVTREGQPLGRGPWKAVLLVPDDGSAAQSGSTERPASWLTARDLVDAGGHIWEQAAGSALDLDQGDVCFFFRGVRRKGIIVHFFPARFRLAVYDVATRRVYVTDPAETRSQNANAYRADLREDGGGSLELLPLYSPRLLLALGWPFLVTLGLTLLTELAVAALWVTLFRPGGTRRFGPVLLTTVAANLLTVPALFGLGVLVKMHVPDDNVAVYLAALFGGPALVIVGEALLYRAWARVPGKQAGFLSTVANVCSLVFCCGGVWAYGW
jgi:hypothetical protein